MNNNVLGNLTLEFEDEEQTYWLTSGWDRPWFSFLVVPKDVFGVRNLVSSKLNFNNENSCFRIHESGFFLERFNHLFPAERFKQCVSLTWNEMALKAQDFLEAKDLWPFYLDNIIEKTELHHNFDQKKYRVTAFLPQEEGVFAYMADDYDPKLNTNWITDMGYSENDYKLMLRKYKITDVKYEGQYFKV